jgi:hypothetical protein
MSLPFKMCETCPLVQNCKGETPREALTKFSEANPHFNIGIGPAFLPGVSYNVSSKEIYKVERETGGKFADGNPHNLDARTTDFSFACATAIMSARLLIEKGSNNSQINTAEAINNINRVQIAIDLTNTIRRHL